MRLKACRASLSVGGRPELLTSLLEILARFKALDTPITLVKCSAEARRNHRVPSKHPTGSARFRPGSGDGRCRAANALVESV
jgi:hypothetical protein